MRAAIDWSYQLLDAGEQRLFARLGVFVAGWTLAVAEAVCNADGDLPFDVLDGLAALLDKSLLKREEGANGEPRFTMLETIREYALERLAERGETEALRNWHLAYYLALAEQARSELDGAQPRAWLDRLHHEYDNLRAALGWAIEQEAVELSVRLASALQGFWFLGGSISEGVRSAMALVARAGLTWPAELRARALRVAGFMVFHQGDYVAASGLLQECEAIYRRLGDKRGLAAILVTHGRVLLFQGEQASANMLLEECTALCEEVGDHGWLAASLLARATVAIDQGDYREARAFTDQSLSIYQALGDPWGLAQAANYLGDIDRCEGNYEQAAARYQESVTLFRTQGIQVEIAAVLHNLGYAVLGLRNLPHARSCFAESLELHCEQGNRPGILEGLAGFGALLTAQGQPQRAAVLFGAIATLRAALSAPMWPAERVEYERYLATARAALDEEAFAAAWAAGHALRLEQAIAEALRIPAEMQPAQKETEMPGQVSQPSSTVPDRLSTLTRRERQVLALVAQGASNRAIADALVIAERTAEIHVSNILGKLGVASRTQAAAYALAHGLADAPDA
jgi:DNA-binding CsgD family transcriptional regulator/tetratricopeptide (TPR) repeat protein